MGGQAAAAIKGKISREHQEKALNLTPSRGHRSLKMIIFDIDVFQICTCNVTNLAAMQVVQCMVVYWGSDSDDGSQGRGSCLVFPAAIFTLLVGEKSDSTASAATA